MELQPIVVGRAPTKVGDMQIRAFPQNSLLIAPSTWEAIGVTIIYDDRATALRAKRFSDLLVASCGGSNNQAPACWRSELIGLPGIAEEIVRDAAGSEFVILSLRGDASLSTEMKAWIEAWLVGAAGGPASLIAQFDPERSVAHHVENTRAYFRQVTASAGVAFFCHSTISPSEPATIPFSADDEPAAQRKSRGRSRNIVAAFFPAAAAA